MTHGRSNLIPGWIISKRRRRARTRLWTAAAVAYGMAVVGCLGAAASSWSTDREGPREDLSTLERENELQRLRSKQLAGAVSSARRTLEANRSVGDRPDWSQFLAVLPEILAGEAGLRELMVRAEEPARPPAQVAGGRSGPAAQGGERSRAREFKVRLAGIALAQTTVPEIVLRLERTGLFERVELVSSRREATGNSGRSGMIVFEVEGLMRSRTEVNSPTPVGAAGAGSAAGAGGVGGHAEKGGQP